ncbi:MAG: hypothetical protein JWR39_576, partial [Devosia sp.]|nr:hypothetical protein [Devosia sp.]
MSLGRFWRRNDIEYWSFCHGSAKTKDLADEAWLP